MHISSFIANLYDQQIKMILYEYMQIMKGLALC